MPTDLYIDGQRYRVVDTPLAKSILDDLRDHFGSSEKLLGLEVEDQSGNAGILRFRPDRLGSIAIIAVDEPHGKADRPPAPFSTEDHPWK